MPHIFYNLWMLVYLDLWHGIALRTFIHELQSNHYISSYSRVISFLYVKRPQRKHLPVELVMWLERPVALILNKSRVLTNPKVNACFQNTPGGSLATSYNLSSLRLDPTLTQSQIIRLTIPSNLNDSIILINSLQSVLTKAEADVTITREKLPQYMAHDKPTPKNRKVLSWALYVALEDLMETRCGVADPLDTKKKRVSKKQPV